MPAKKDFEIHLKFNSIKEFEQSFKEPVNWKGNRFRNCTLCKFDRTHKMREMRGDWENIKSNPTGDKPCRRQIYVKYTFVQWFTHIFKSGVV